jgi:formylglycine-generating enzyme required for sulfatase activity
MKYLFFLLMFLPYTIYAQIETVEIPAGSFKMGETSPFLVVISIPFLMGKYEVTQKQYSDVIGSNPSSFVLSDNHPVENVDWLDAIKFCNELSSKKGYELCYRIGTDSTWQCDFDKNGYRLPTEAEWEYACKAGTTTDYYSGTTESELATIAWYRNNSENKTHQVGLKVANAFGLYDMSGNVNEWCWDWHTENISGPIQDPRGPYSGIYKAVRGGSWSDGTSSCVSADRKNSKPTTKHNRLGFRIARTKVGSDVEDMNPKRVNLENHPNPFVQNTTISFTLDKLCNIELSIYDINGNLLKSLISGIYNSGDYKIEWDGTNYSGNEVTSGTYFYQLEVDNSLITKQLTILK